MEFAAAVLTSVAEGIGAIAGASAPLDLLAANGVAGASGSGLFGGLMGGSTALSILQGGATVASVLATAGAGQQKADAYMLQAGDAETAAQLERVQGIERRTSLKASLLQAIGERDVAAAASGVDLSFGTPAIARDQALKDGARALEVDTSTEEFRRARLFERAASYRNMASQARAGSLLQALGGGLEGAAKIARRG